MCHGIRNTKKYPKCKKFKAEWKVIKKITDIDKLDAKINNLELLVKLAQLQREEIKTLDSLGEVRDKITEFIKEVEDTFKYDE